MSDATNVTQPDEAEETQDDRLVIRPNLALPAPMWRRTKSLAAEKGVSVQQFVTEILAEYLKRTS